MAELDSYSKLRAGYARGWLCAERHRDTLDEATQAQRRAWVATLNLADPYTAAFQRGYVDALTP